MAKFDTSFSLNEKIDELSVDFSCKDNILSLEIYFQNNLVFKQVLSDESNKIPEIIMNYSTEKKVEYLNLLRKNVKLFIDNNLDILRASCIMKIYSALCNISFGNYDLLNKNISPKTNKYLEELETDGRIKPNGKGKYELIVKPMEFVSWCFDRRYIGESKNDVDDLTPEIIFDNIEMGIEFESLKKYIRDMKAPKEKKNPDKSG